MPELTLDIHSVRAAAAQATALLKAMANVDRLLLLCQLSQSEHSVGELESLLGVTQPTLSQQLGVLRDEGLVATRREGKQIYYRIASPVALAIIQILYTHFCQKSGVQNDA